MSVSAQRSPLRWIVGGAIALVLAILLFALQGLLVGVRPIGDGRDPATYGFDLSNLSVPREALSASGNPRDFWRSLDNPKTLEGSEVAARNEGQRQKYAVSEDRVIGITINGESRAYPLSLMNVHEVVNDTLGGVPVCVTYSPLCDSAVIFDRRVGGTTLEFGVSGLVLNNNLVMYDKAAAPASAPSAPQSQSPASQTPAHESSLWSQLAFSAIAGPARSRGERLTALPGVQVSTWASWLLERPATTIAMPEETDWRRMKETDYRRYWRDGKPTFPVVSIPGDAREDRSIPFAEINPSAAPLMEAAISEMTMVIAVHAPDGWRIVPLRSMEALRATPEGYVDTAVLGVPRIWVLVPVYGALLVDETDPPLMVPCRWFAWNSFHPAKK